MMAIGIGLEGNSLGVMHTMAMYHGGYVDHHASLTTKPKPCSREPPLRPRKLLWEPEGF